MFWGRSVGYELSNKTEFLPVMYMSDCWLPVAQNPGLNIYRLSFGISYSCIYYPLEAFWFALWEQRKKWPKIGSIFTLPAAKSTVQITWAVYSTLTYCCAKKQDKLWVLLFYNTWRMKLSISQHISQYISYIYFLILMSCKTKKQHYDLMNTLPFKCSIS